MHRLIDTGLEQLTAVVCKMGDAAERAVELSLDGYVNSKTSTESVREISDILETMSLEVENKVFELIAKYQPVASDLRIIKSYMKIAYDFERYGRYALDTSSIGDQLGGLKDCDGWMRDFVTEMSSKVIGMVKMSLQSLRNFDATLARAISETENQVDKMYFDYLDKLVQRAPAASKCTISSVLVIRYLERIADHATYICESVVYLATGEKITLR